MSVIVGRLSFILKQASDDFYFDDFHKSGCWTMFCCSPRLNQVIVIKFPSRVHYITKKLARQYLQNTRKLVEEKVGTAFFKKAYVLNVLISSQISQPCCLELADIKYDQRNLDMVFNPREVSEIKIVQAICKALATKTGSWHDKIRQTCVDKKIKPYGNRQLKIKYLNHASQVFWRFSHGKRGDKK